MVLSSRMSIGLSVLLAIKVTAHKSGRAAKIDVGRSFSGIWKLWREWSRVFTVPYCMQAVPPQLKSLLEASPIKPNRWYYWWRAQSAAYIVKPNARTRNEIAARKRRVFAGERIRPGTISVHVRHGDKIIESALVEDIVYLKVVEDMRKSQV